MEAELITIGDEILIGQIVDTNSAWMGSELNKEGISVRQITSVSDRAEEITRALDQGLEKADIILITGGLGPTKDDITKHTLSNYFNSELIISQVALDNVLEIFKRFNRPFLNINRRQAEVPACCTVLLNTQGTAPGMWFEKNNKVIVSMPGVPHEMKNLMLTEVLPRLKERFSLPYIHHFTMLTAGIGESFLADILQPIEDRMPDNIRMAYLPSLGTLKLRLSSQGENKSLLIQETEKIAAKIRHLAQKYIVAEQDIPLAQVIITKLGTAGKTLAFAESCSGGYLAHKLTSIAGSSHVFKGSIVAYSNELKEKLLGVDAEILIKYGAVSEEAARQMAVGMLKVSESDYVISITGIAGPGGATEDKPVGLVYIGVGNKEKIHVARLQFGKERMTNIERSANHALMLLNRFFEDPLSIP